MKIFTGIESLRKEITLRKRRGESIGFVPTMGYLHDGHLSLVRHARSQNSCVVLSIYVNPAQFSPQEDLDTYPRDLDRDLELAENEGVDIVFMPDDRTIYPPGFGTYVEVEEVTGNLCGSSRPGHFRGVATVVAKLFNMVDPHRSYFGRKDAQQAAVIKKMVRDLNFSVEIVVCPIVREPDGLAMSSRNACLNGVQREQALVLRQALLLARELFDRGERSAGRILGEVIPLFEETPQVELDYIKIVDPLTMEDIDDLERGGLLAVAAFVGKTRLIDNELLEE